VNALRRGGTAAADRASAGPAATAAAPAGQPSLPGPLFEALLDCAARRVSGVLRVTGDPGGAIHLAEGGVAAIETPGAPSPEVLLLRSGRIPEPGWAAAFTAAAPDGDLAGELIKRDLVGAGELEVLLRTALADAMFVLACGQVTGCELDQPSGDCLLPLMPPGGVGWLLAEASRRIQVLGSLPSFITHDRDRVAPASRRPAGTLLGGGQDQVLALANGRRTPRDIAFAAGRGVFSVTLQVARMHASGVLVIESRRPVSPAVPGAGQASPGPAGGTDGTGSGPERGQPGLLPRRKRGSGPGQGRPVAGLADRSALLRLLRPGSGHDQDQGG
jgi:hypothetical protein